MSNTISVQYNKFTIAFHLEHFISPNISYLISSDRAINLQLTELKKTVCVKVIDIKVVETRWETRWWETTRKTTRKSIIAAHLQCGRNTAPKFSCVCTMVTMVTMGSKVNECYGRFRGFYYCCNVIAVKEGLHVLPLQNAAKHGAEVKQMCL